MPPYKRGKWFSDWAAVNLKPWFPSSVWRPRCLHDTELHISFKEGSRKDEIVSKLLTFYLFKIRYVLMNGQQQQVNRNSYKNRKTTFLILPGLAEITMVSVNAHVRHQHRLFEQSKDAQVSTTIIIIFPGNIIPQIGKSNWHSAHIVYQCVSYVNSTCLFAFVYLSHPGYQGAYCFWSGSVPRRRHWGGLTFQTSGNTLEVIPFKPHVIDMFAWENLMFILVTLGQDHAAAKVISTSTCPRQKL